MYTYLLMAESSSPKDEVEVVDHLGTLVNRYGFLTVFAIIVLVLAVIFFIKHEKRSGKKQEQEMELSKKEKDSAIERTDKIYDLAANLLTSQIAQLQQMTDTLKDINHTVQSNETKVIDAMSKFEEIKGSVKSCDENSKIILDTISDILSYVKTSQTCNQEILFKVNLLEHKLITADTKLTEQQ